MKDEEFSKSDKGDDSQEIENETCKSPRDPVQCNKDSDLEEDKKMDLKDTDKISEASISTTEKNCQ